MKWVYIIAGGLAALIALVVAIGFFLPQGHLASREATYRQSPDAIWAVLTDVANAGGWRSGLTQVEVLPPQGGNPVWRETWKDGTKVTFESVEQARPSRLVNRIVDKDLPFGGRWIFELAPATGGTRVKVTEEGEVYNPIFRFVSHFFMSQTASIDDYLKALGRKFGEDVTIGG